MTSRVEAPMGLKLGGFSKRRLCGFNNKRFAMSDKWGVGAGAESKAFGRAFLGKQQVELIHGEHPHSRSDNNTYARTEGGQIWEFDGHRVLVDVDLRSSNYLKDSYLSGTEIRKSCSAVIKFDGDSVYEVHGREPHYVLLRVVSLLNELMDHPSGLWRAEDRAKLVGRKVFYHGTPAIITRFIGDQGCVMIEVDGADRFPPPVWREDASDDYEDTRKVKDDILSPHIWWFRDDRSQGPTAREAQSPIIASTTEVKI